MALLKKKGSKKMALKVKNVKAKPKRAKTARSAGATVLAQGAGAVPRRNFGTNGCGKKQSVMSMVKCLDARLPRTLGLPRAVGPYTVIRTSSVVASSSFLTIFSPMTLKSSATRWANWCGVTAVDDTLPMNAVDNTKPIIMPLSALDGAAEAVPSAMTVQVMNPASLQTAEGTFFMSRISQQLAMGGTTQTWQQVAASLIAYFSPRLMTGGKLALRGVKCDAMPLDMSEYSSFKPIEKTGYEPFTWNAASGEGWATPAALSPIVFMQANNTPQTMNFLVTIEWRVRFDPGSAAAASHTHHDTLPDESWNEVVRHMSAAGHGVQELSEDTSDAGALPNA